MMPKIKCRICSKKEAALWKKGLHDESYFTFTEVEYSLYVCRECGSMTLSPLPSLDRLSEIYPADYSSFLRPKPRKSILKRILTSPHDIRFGRTERIPSIFGGGRLLDFGCGAGQQLHEAAAKGWEVNGVDYSKDALDHARRNAPSANLWIGGIEAIPNDLVFDCVTAFHVLEHLENPSIWLKAVYDRMAPNGVLRIEVPIPCPIMQFIFRGHYNAYDVPRHFSVPSPRGLDILLRASGFQPISQTPILFPTCLSESIDRSFQALFRVRVRSDIRRLNYLASIGPMAFLSAMGMVCVLSIDSRKL